MSNKAPDAVADNGRQTFPTDWLQVLEVLPLVVAIMNNGGPS